MVSRDLLNDLAAEMVSMATRALNTKLCVLRESSAAKAWPGLCPGPEFNGGLCPENSDINDAPSRSIVAGCPTHRGCEIHATASCGV